MNIPLTIAFALSSFAVVMAASPAYVPEDMAAVLSDRSLALLDGIEIVQGSGVTADVVAAIIAVRGKKQTTERWIVDMLNSDVRIRKSRTDGVSLPPGGATEFWFRTSDNTWKARPTA